MDQKNSKRGLCEALMGGERERDVSIISKIKDN